MLASNIHEYTVSELSFSLKRTVEDAYAFVRVRGELSGFKRAASGHLYFALKDDRACLDAVVWRGTLPKIGFEPEDGLEVVCTGRLTTYPGRSKYQLSVEQMEPAGVGALMALLEERKRKLEAEGLFAAERKRPLPLLPGVIGIVTSPTGAVIRDILHRLEERFPRRVIVWPVLVQGEGAAEQIAGAIAGFGRLAEMGAIPRPDVLIVARGGGSIEDLWAFNDEIVVRAAAASPIPLISAVGHETDTTLIDFAADRRAPTPTAAAEIAVPVRVDCLDRVQQLGARQDGAIQRSLRELATGLAGLARGLPEPRQLIRTAGQRLDDLGERLRLRSPTAVLAAQQELLLSRSRRIEELLKDRLRGCGETVRNLAARLSLEPIRAGVVHGARELAREQARLDAAQTRRLADAGDRLSAVSSLLESLGPGRVLERGYAIVRSQADGSVLSSAAVAGRQELWRVVFADGEVTAGPVTAPSKRRRPGQTAEPVDAQGSLI
jgi:exodeoxyribonuclease VII large subunit